jgi:single-strand DNA-binding protein
MLNHITLMGRLVRDPELRTTQSGTPVASFTLAVDRDYSGRDGGEKQTDFIDCVAWRGTGEFVSKYFQKGSMAVVSGRLQIRDWTDKEGNKRRNAEVNAENIYFGESKKRDSEPTTRGDSYDSDLHYSRPADSKAALNDLVNQYPGVVKRGAFSELNEDDGDLPF